MFKQYKFSEFSYMKKWGCICLPALFFFGSCAENKNSGSFLPIYTLEMCSGKFGWQIGDALDINTINIPLIKLEDSVGPRKNWDDLKKVDAIGPWKQYRVPGLVVAMDAGVSLNFLTNVADLGLSDLSDVVLVPGSRVGIVMSVGSPRQNVEQAQKWRNYFSVQYLPDQVFSNYSIQTENGSWPFYQEFSRYITGNPPTTFFASPENLWRCNVSQIEEPIGNEDWVSCDAFYPKVDAALKVVFQRSLICHTPAIAVTVEAFLAKLLKS